MSSYEDRIGVVKLYIKLGKLTGATIWQLGYPGRETLAAWFDELYPESKHPVVGKARSVPRP